MDNTHHDYTIDQSKCLSHHGIKGQRWGIRRYQNPDGTLTSLGKRRVKAALKKRDSSIEVITSTSEFNKRNNDFIRYARKLTESERNELIKKMTIDDELRSINANVKINTSNIKSKYIDLTNINNILDTTRKIADIRKVWVSSTANKVKKDNNDKTDKKKETKQTIQTRKVNKKLYNAIKKENNKNDEAYYMSHESKRLH